MKTTQSFKRMRRIRRILILALAAALGLSSYTYLPHEVLASETPDESDVQEIQEEIDEQQQEIDKTHQQEIDETEDKKQKLQEAKENMENYLADLNRQYASLEDEIQDLNQQITDKQAEIEEAQAALEAAKAVEEQQYADMVHVRAPAGVVPGASPDLGQLRGRPEPGGLRGQHYRL